jgi:hypothetical protein
MAREALVAENGLDVAPILHTFRLRAQRRRQDNRRQGSSLNQGIAHYPKSIARPACLIKE